MGPLSRLQGGSEGPNPRLWGGGPAPTNRRAGGGRLSHPLPARTSVSTPWHEQRGLRLVPLARPPRGRRGRTRSLRPRQPPPVRVPAARERIARPPHRPPQTRVGRPVRRDVRGRGTGARRCRVQARGSRGPVHAPPGSGLARRPARRPAGQGRVAPDVEVHAGASRPRPGEAKPEARTRPRGTPVGAPGAVIGDGDARPLAEAPYAPAGVGAWPREGVAGPEARPVSITRPGKVGSRLDVGPALIDVIAKKTRP